MILLWFLISVTCINLGVFLYDRHFGCLNYKINEIVSIIGISLITCGVGFILIDIVVFVIQHIKIV